MTWTIILHFYNMPLEQIIIFGHSFVCACDWMCQRDDDLWNLGLDHSEKPVYFTGNVDGEDIVLHNQIVPWLDLASNDLKGFFFFKDGKSLAANMFTIVIYLRNAGVKRVGIFECMKRSRFRMCAFTSPWHCYRSTDSAV